MKKETTNTHRIYLRTLVNLRAIIEQEYDDGGWLPSERIMCEKLNVSRMTYRKVLGWLVTEDVVKSVPRCGHWVLEKNMRCRKIGIIIAYGTESPFISYGNFLSGVLDSLGNHLLKAHLIQASRLENIHISALSHAVEGLIWIHPPNEAFDYIRQIQADGIPIVSVSYLVGKAPTAELDKLLKNIHYVGLDFVASTRIAAEIMIECGYRRILFLGSGDYDAYQALAEVFQKANIPFSQEQLIHGIEGLGTKLKMANQKCRVDAILADGGWDRLEPLFQFYRTIPAEKRPVLILPNADNVINLYKKYKDIHISGFQIFSNKYLAETATNMLVKYIYEGRKMTSILKPAYDIKLEE